MTDLFLAVIAVAVLVIAASQVVAVVFAARTIRRVGEAVDRLEQDVRPIVTSLQAVSQETARATAMAAAQLERVDRMFGDLARRMDDTVGSLQHALLGPAREWMALLHGLKAAIGALRDRGDVAGRRAVPVEEEDPLFIG